MKRLYKMTTYLIIVMVLTACTPKTAEPEVDKQVPNKIQPALITDDGSERLTYDALMAIVESGETMSLSTFDPYTFEDIGSGLYIFVYPMDIPYYLMIGSGSLDGEPMYIRLYDNETGESIDIMEDDISSFVAIETSTIEPVEPEIIQCTYLDLCEIGVNEQVLVEEIVDLNQDGIDEIVVGIGNPNQTEIYHEMTSIDEALKENTVTKFYLISQEEDYKLIGFIDNTWGYSICSMSIIYLEGNEQAYIYCGLTNSVNLVGFSLYEYNEESLDQIDVYGYSASATGAGTDILLDSNQNDLYDAYIQYRSGYDVAYMYTKRIYTYTLDGFVLDSVDIELPPYPEAQEELVWHFLSLMSRLTYDGISVDLQTRLKAIYSDYLTIDLQPLYMASYYHMLGMDETIQVLVDETLNTIRITYTDSDNEETVIFDFTVEHIDNRWQVTKVQKIN